MKPHIIKGLVSQQVGWGQSKIEFPKSNSSMEEGKRGGNREYLWEVRIC